MGLLGDFGKALQGAVAGAMADQWREYFYCNVLPNDVLVARGKRQSSDSSVNRGSKGVISKGSVFAVNEGQCLLIVENGKVVEVRSEAGEFTWNGSSESSVFTGTAEERVSGTLESIGRRVSFGGDTGIVHRVYYVNTKEIMGIHYRTASPVPFRLVDEKSGLQLDASIRCSGEYSIRITDPALFYKNVCGNVLVDYRRSELEGQLESELLTALQAVLGKIGSEGMHYSEVPAHTVELADALNEELSEKWGKLRGIKVVSVGINHLYAVSEDARMIKDIQRTAVFTQPDMAGAALTTAQSDAMRMAAANESAGPMMAFAGLNMAQQAGGMNPASRQQNAVTGAKSWTCACGMVNKGKFCMECGAKQPEGWMCSCGHVNKGKFCEECGAKKPADAPQYRCDKCGWEPEDPLKPPKFCPECGDAFDASDIM